MFTDNQKEILKIATGHYGTILQTNMALEESIELALSIKKILRSNNVDTLSNMAGEIADVLIMIEQLKMMYPGLTDQISYYIDKKIERLNSNIMLELNLSWTDASSVYVTSVAPGSVPGAADTSPILILTR